MTKKHYTAIAAILADFGAKCHAVNLTGLHMQTCSDLADYFATDNKNFDRTRFLTACGIETNTCSHKNCDNVVEEKGDECRTCYEKNM